MAVAMTFRELAQLIGAEASEAAPMDGALSRVSSIEAATATSIVFASSEAALAAALSSEAGAILAGTSARVEDARLLRVHDPKYAFALAARALSVERHESQIHPTAVIDPSVRIGARVTIGPHVTVEAEVSIGEGSVLGPNVTVHRGTEIGRNVVVKAGAVLGGTGFGFVRNTQSGEYLLFPQQGCLVIEDDVEIGANTTIDRGALGETRIGQGTKIDNQVHIAHNCRIGRHVVMAAQVGISGSCTVGDFVVMAGQVGLGDHVTIGAGVILGGACGVFPGKTLEGTGEMFMGVPAVPLREYLRTTAKMRRL